MKQTTKMTMNEELATSILFHKNAPKTTHNHYGCSFREGNSRRLGNFASREILHMQLNSKQNKKLGHALIRMADMLLEREFGGNDKAVKTFSITL